MPDSNAKPRPEPTSSTKKGGASALYDVDTTYWSDKRIGNALRDAGWKHEPHFRTYRSHGRTCVTRQFDAYTREVRVDGKEPLGPEPLSQNSGQQECTANPLVNDAVDPAMSPHRNQLTATGPDGSDGHALSIQDIPSIAAVRSGLRPSVDIAEDTEFVTRDGRRYLISHQYSVADPRDPGLRHDVIVFPNRRRLRRSDATAWLIDRYELWAHPFSNVGEDGFDYRKSRCWHLPFPRGNNVIIKSFGTGEEAAKAVEEFWPDGDCPYELKRSEGVGRDGKRTVYYQRALSEDLSLPDSAPIAGEVSAKDISRLFTARSGRLYLCPEAQKLGGKPEIGYVNDFGEIDRHALPITIVMHTAKADLTAYDFSGDYEQDLLVRCSQVQGGLVTLRSPRPAHVSLPDKYWCFWPVTYAVRDTMCLSPAGRQTLEALGETVDVPKHVISDKAVVAVAEAVGARLEFDSLYDELKLEELSELVSQGGIDSSELTRALAAAYGGEKVVKGHMDAFLRLCPKEFAEYASQDTAVVLAYTEALFGPSTKPPVTMTSAATKVAKSVMGEYLSSTTKNGDYGFDELYRGLRKENGGLVARRDRPGYIQDTKLVPISDDADRAQRFGQHCYHGGYNASLIIGLISVLTYDLDLENAYPSAMACVMDIDWTHPDGCILETIDKRELTEQDFHTPFDPIFAYVEFEFPEDVPFPCIPVSVEGSLVYPRTSEGLDGVYACGPELWLALELGARVFVKRGVTCRVKLEDRDDGHEVPSRSLFRAVKALVNDRALAKRAFGKGSLAELILKVMVNSLYGKTAQDVVEKSTYDAYHDRMVGLGGSSITSPVHAALTTASVRAVLLATMDQLHESGYHTYSVTTDGMITDATCGLVESLDLYGLAGYFREARESLVGDPTMWAEKHRQNDLLNFTTRGNVALDEGGVCAHNSFVTGAPKGGYEDRALLMDAVMRREGKVKCYKPKWKGFRDLAARGATRSDFVVDEDAARELHMDFDLKRKPVRESVADDIVKLDGDYGEAVFGLGTGSVSYGIAHFDTVPFDSVAEYELYRGCAKAIRTAGGALRTASDWAAFFARVLGSTSGVIRHLKDFEWAAVRTVVMGHRLGLWTVPELARTDMSVREKCAWINRFNRSSRLFKPSDWNNARRGERASQMLPREAVADLLDEMMRG